MKTLLTLIFGLLACTAHGQSTLSTCTGDLTTKWTNCFGSWTGSIGDKYVGEWKNGNFHGQGSVTFFNWGSYIGEFNNGKMHGKGTATYVSGNKYVGEWMHDSMHGQGVLLFSDGSKFVGEFQNHQKEGKGIKYLSNNSVVESGIYSQNTLIKSEIINPQNFNRITFTNTQLAVTDSQVKEIEQRERQIELEVKRLAEERRSLEEDKRQRELAKQSSRMSITAISTQPDSSGVVTINIQTNTDTSSLKINGEELGGKVDGNYLVKRVARVGQDTKFTISGVDVNGNTDSKTITVVRQAVDSKAVFGQLNAANVKQQPAKDAVAIIIGIEKYKRVVKADFANADAQVFYDYAVRALGVKPENIKLLVDEGADDVEIYKAFQNWLPVKVKKGKTDVYVFYSGHGYPGQDGNSLYILPFGADKDLISKTAINQQEIVNAIQSAQPRNVTMFLDSCYSGQTRGGDVLIAAARPIAPKISSTSYPPNFTVISASSNDQISSASPDLKHGIFSYFLMKGMEGDADQNKDGKTTIAEMQEYLTDMVGRQAMGMNRKQQPQLFGDPNKVLFTR
jgi:hypothetical protein